MLDDSGLALGAIRQGAGQFIEALQGKAEFAIITMGGRNLPLVDFTKDPPTLYAALQKLFARNSPPTYVLDGFLEVAQTFTRRKAERPVIVAVATEGEELSDASADTVLDAIQKSGATLYYIGLGAPVTQALAPRSAPNSRTIPRRTSPASATPCSDRRRGTRAAAANRRSSRRACR